MIHHVQKGENIFSIEKKYGVSTRKIAVDNRLLSPRNLVPGQELLILTPARTYKTVPGDTADLIAEKCHITKKALLKNNPEMRSDGRLCPGQTVAVTYPRTTHGALTINGYVYPDCDRSHFEWAQAHVQFFTFSAAITDGVSLQTVADYSNYRKLAQKRQIPTFFRITRAFPFREEVFQDEKKSADLSYRIVKTAKDLGFDGITTGFYGSKNAKDSSFWQLLKSTAKENKLLFFNETDGNQRAPLCEYADATVLMYEKANDKNPPMFEEGETAVLSYYEKTGKASKIMVDISPFGYRNGLAMPKKEALRQAVSNGSEICYDEQTKLSSYCIKDTTTVFESLENNKAKFDLCDELGFMGITLDVMRSEAPLFMLAATEFAPVDYVFYAVKDGI